MSQYSFDNTKTMDSSTREQSKAQCQKIVHPPLSNFISPPSRIPRRVPSTGFQSPNCKREHCPVRKQVLLRFSIGGKVFEETFMILPTMGNILIGMSFFEKYSVTLDLANNVVKFPDITLQFKPERVRYKIQMIELRTTQKTVIQPDHQLIVPVLAERDLGTIQGTVETFPAFERKTQLLVSPALTQIADMKSHVQITNLTSHTITLNPKTTVATFRIMTPNRAHTRVLTYINNQWYFDVYRRF